jgi:hypothetical protein
LEEEDDFCRWKYLLAECIAVISILNMARTRVKIVSMLAATPKLHRLQALGSPVSARFIPYTVCHQ